MTVTGSPARPWRRTRPTSRARTPAVVATTAIKDDEVRRVIDEAIQLRLGSADRSLEVLSMRERRQLAEQQESETKQVKFFRGRHLHASIAHSSTCRQVPARP